MEISVSFVQDENGLTGRECPACEKYFKIRFGTGLPDVSHVHCPYCNHTGPQTEFWTKEQVEYARSIAINQFSVQLLEEVKRTARSSRKSIGITVRGNPTPIVFYSERDLEEHLTCSVCTLEYAIYGTFGYCPDCGTHNSKQIVTANLDLVLRLLDLAATTPSDIQAKLIENALEDAVAAFDGFGREHCSRLSGKISFQNIGPAREKLLKVEGLDIAIGLTAEQWGFVCEQFQKRHLVAHKMGIIDEEFARRTGHSPSLVGRKVPISETDVRLLVSCLQVMVDNVVTGFHRT